MIIFTFLFVFTITIASTLFPFQLLPDPVRQWRQASSQCRLHSSRLRSPRTPHPCPRLTRPSLCLNGSTLHPNASTHKRSSRATGLPPHPPLHSLSPSDCGSCQHQAYHHAALSAVRHSQRRELAPSSLSAPQPMK